MIFKKISEFFCKIFKTSVGRHHWLIPGFLVFKHDWIFKNKHWEKIETIWSKKSGDVSGYVSWERGATPLTSLTDPVTFDITPSLYSWPLLFLPWPRPDPPPSADFDNTSITSTFNLRRLQPRDHISLKNSDLFSTLMPLATFADNIILIATRSRVLAIDFKHVVSSSPRHQPDLSGEFLPPARSHNVCNSHRRETLPLSTSIGPLQHNPHLT